MPAAVFCIYCGTPVVPLAEQIPLKPGKGYGIRSLFWAAVGLLALLTFVLIEWLISIDVLVSEPFHNSLWSAIVACLILSTPFCIVAGFVYGIMGRNTEGRRYAYIGIVLSVLYIILPVFLFILFILLIIADNIIVQIIP